jgi:ribosomal protein S18 acetylase RimI-like enzyme
MRFRELECEDLPEIFEVRVATWHNARGREELAGMGITPESVREMMGRSHRGWLCEVDGRIVGFAMGDKESGEMWVIAVLKEFESRGIGRQLLEHVENWLRLEGWDEIWLTTDPEESFRAVGFYRHLGWTGWRMCSNPVTERAKATHAAAISG